jgi:ribosomal protein S12 methylthiotransferase accessory factor
MWATAIVPGPDRAACAAGAHPSPEHAALNALSELGPLVSSMIRHPPDADHVRPMVTDPARVTTLDDHWTLYAIPETFHRLDFLTDVTGRPARTLAPTDERFHGDDLTEDLRALVGRLLDHIADVIVVDQTTPEHRANDLACVKVLAPGLIPITFGHAYRRTHGLPRLLNVPYELGYRPRPLRYEELNPHPHPFA